MRSILLIIFMGSGLFNLETFAQVKLKSRTIHPENNISSFDYLSFSKQSNGENLFCLVYFDRVVSEQQKHELAANGILLFDYIPDNAYTAVINQNISPAFLETHHVYSIFQLSSIDKLSPALLSANIPARETKQTNTVDLVVHFSKGIKPIEASNFLRQQYLLIDTSWSDYHFFSLRTDQKNINELAAIPFIEYIEPLPPDPKPFNFLMRSNSRANVLNASPSSGGEGLLGKGVTIGIGDDADPSDHVDLYDRVINRAAGLQQTHGTHVAGIAAGGGLKDPIFQGVAPQATIVAQLFNGIFLNAAAYFNDYRMVITNNSWGNITGECDLSGVYDTYSKLMDDIAIQYPYLLNIFAAGNDGPYTCNGFPQQYHTIVSGHQSAKNVLSVGWGEKNMTVSPFSSIGPAADGRLKPEITSQGSGVRSTAPKNEYFTDWGTSMAAPSVAGGAALLVEKYRLMNSDADPKSGLVKALLMNGARDIENPAPDHKSGYGFLNLVRSIDILKNNRHITSAITNGALNTHSITVPPGVSQLKVMIYWHDPSAAIFAQQALVNDVDLKVITPTGAVFLPWSLTSDSNNVTAPAIRAADHRNNSEQVTIDVPAPGIYNIEVKGNSINSGPSQEYFVVYDFVPTGIDLTYPSVAEPLTPGENIVIQWDAWGEPVNDFTLEYSLNDGTSWNTISTAVPSITRQFNWTVPSVVTDKAKVRILRNESSQSDESRPFVILSQPLVSLAAIQCEGYVNLNWNSVFGATDYEVMMKQGTEMVPVAITTNESYVFSGLNKDSVYWFTVRARINGNAGRRAVAVNRRPADGNCAGNISDNDLQMDSIVSPVTGRKFTSTEITATSLSVRVKNLDDAPANSFIISYSVNGGAFISENVSVNIPANGSYLHSFYGLNFSAPGSYNVVAVVKNNNPDVNTLNDTLRITIRQIANAPVSLPFTENFDPAPAFEFNNDVVGLPSMDHWDYINTTDTGRIRSFVNTGISKSGNRAISLDTRQYISSGNTNYLVGTFNLASFSSISPTDLGLKLEFAYKQHGQQPHQDNKVWVRQNDNATWLPVFNLDSLSLFPGEWKTVSIHLTPFITSHTTSFQVRFGQHGNFPIGDNISNDGVTIDDVKLVSAVNDVELVEILSPVVITCDKHQSIPVTIKYVDHHGITTCIPVKYRVNRGAVIAECITAVANGIYSFNSQLKIPSTGPVLLEVWSDFPADTYRLNDTLRLNIVNKPAITKFPYVESFENGKGDWHAEGYRSSWEYGMPASLKIRSAASGTKAWKTKLNGQYNENEHSYLYSPCFDITSLSSPFLSFNMALDIEQCGVFACDKLWIEYSSDGKDWTKLGTYAQGINWYNNITENAWDSANFTNWHKAGIALPTGINNLRLRFVLQSDAGVTREGVAIDDIRIYDRQNSSDPAWLIYPNPFTDFLLVESVHDANLPVDLQLFDASGRLIHQQRFVASGFLDKTTLTLGHLAKGIYALKISDGSNRKIFRLVKQ